MPVYGSNGIIDTHSAANTLSPAIIVGRKGSLGKIQYSDVPCFVTVFSEKSHLTE